MKAAEKAVTFLPDPILRWIENGERERRFPAVVAFADVSGFTQMSTQLASIGKEGAEWLTSILNRYFTAMIGRIEVAGGFVGKFGGDAMTIFFPADSEDGLEQAARRAVATSLNLQAAMTEFHQVKTKAGNFSLGMKIGVAEGGVLFRNVGSGEGGCEYLLAGMPLDRAAEAEHHGKSGDVVITATLAKYCALDGEPIDGDFLKLPAHAPPPPFDALKRRKLRSSIKRTEIAKNFIDSAVYRRLLLGLDSVGEIRRSSVIFMSFSGLDYDEDPEVGTKLEAIYSWVHGIVDLYGGSINKVDMGDKGSKMIVTFGAPKAHENDEELAVHCGLELVGGREEFREWGVDQRIGLATGTVFAGEVGAASRQEYTVMGTVVNLSARLMAHSQPGQLLIDQATRNRSDSKFDFSEPAKVKFKGISEPLPVYEVVGIKAKKAKVFERLTPLIGRAHEREQILKALDEAQHGALKILLIRGDPGTGKTRLAQEALQEAHEQGMILAAGEALSYAKRSPYLIWNSIIRHLMGLPASGGGAEVFASLDEQVRAADREHAYRTPIVAGVLGIKCPDNEITKHFDAQLRQENMFDFLVQYFRHQTTSGAAAIHFEDAQWIDRNSLELIVYLQRNLAKHPLLFIFTRRPYSKNFTSVHIKTIESAAIVIDVKDFERPETERLVLRELGAASIDPDSMDFFYKSSHGNASFVLELVRSLQRRSRVRLLPDSESGGLMAESTGSLAEIEVPDSLNSLIMSQLDHLEAEAKLTVSVAAVVGNRFSEEVVTHSYPVKADDRIILKSIKELETVDLVKREEAGDFFNYIFKNLLTREVAYDSLLFAHRREYHRRVGLILENLQHESLYEWCEELARHFYQSDDDLRATQYLTMAGDKAYALFANEGAEDFYTRGLERSHPETQPDQRYQLLSVRSQVYAIMGKTELQKGDIDEAIALAERRGDMVGKVNNLSNLARYYFRLNNLAESKQVIDEAHAILETIDYPVGEAMIISKLGQWKFSQNDYKGALEEFLRGVEAAERIDDKTGYSEALSNCGRVYRVLGDMNRAMEYYDRSMEFAIEEGNLKSEAVALGNKAVLYHRRGDLDHALEAFQRAIEIGRSIGSKEIQARNLGNMATILLRKGERKRSLQSQQEKLEIEKMMGYLPGQVTTLQNMGIWYCLDGDFNRAISFLQQSLGIAKDLNLKSQIPELLLNIGLAFHYLGDLDVAEERLKEAIERSVEVQNKPSEDYARRFYGFVLIDRGDYTGAKEQFEKALEIATALGSKVSIASSKIGLGWLAVIENNSKQLIEEGIDIARKIGHTETLVKGLVGLARAVVERTGDKAEGLKHLKEALEIARGSGLRCDVQIIEPLMSTFRK